MTVYLCSLGCARNLVDSEVMLGALEKAGHELTEKPDAADTIIVNTCGFIESASEEAVDTILELAGYKTSGKCRRIIVTGCLPQRYGKEIAAELTEVDIFLGTGAYDRIVEAVEGRLPAGEAILTSPEYMPMAMNDSPRVRSTSPVAYIKIMEGCNRYCTYCIIPKLRGRLRSRRPADIVEEAGQLAASGFKEIVVIGQDTTSYGTDLDPPGNLSSLLGRIASAAPDQWIRFLYGHPDRIDDALLQTVADHDNICSYFDIPVQHVSAPVLKKMGRRNDEEQLYRLFERIRTAVPDAALRTTAMVGFPGETENDFSRLIDFIREVRFDHLGTFVYSDADDLPSHALPDHVPPEVAQDRLDRLMRVQADISFEKNHHRMDRVFSVLVEEQEAESLFIGRTAFQAPEVDGITVINADHLKTGEFVNVRITETTEYDLEGVPA